MNPRTTGIVFLVAALLAAFVYFYEIRGGEQRKLAEEREKRLFPGVEAEDVAWFELTTSDGRDARLERRDDRWQLVAPVDFPGDAFAADAISSAVAGISSDAVLESPQPDAVYGLDRAEREVRFGTSDAEHALRVGNKAPMGATSYAKDTASDEVATVSTASVSAFTKSLDDLRDKRILSFDTSSVERISLGWPGGGVVLARGEDGWRITSPIQGRADEPSVESLLSDLSFLRANGFIDAPPPDAELGLDAPALSVEFTAAPAEEGGEPVVRRLAIGSRADGNDRAVRAAQTSLYKIASERLEDFPRELVAYRFRQLAEFPLTDASWMKIVFDAPVSSPSGEGRLEIAATRDEVGWSATPESFAAGKLEGLVSALSRLRAEDILADSLGPDELAGLGLSPPRALFAVHGADPDAPPLAEIEIGIVRGDSGIIARAAGDETVYVLGLDQGERIPVSLDAFRNRFSVPPEEEDAEDAEPADDAPEDAEDAEPADDAPADGAESP